MVALQKLEVLAIMRPHMQGFAMSQLNVTIAIFAAVSDVSIKYATEEWLKEQSELFYFTGIEKLRQCYKLCIDKGGDYVEK